MEYISRKRVIRTIDDWWRTSTMANGKPTLDALIRVIPTEDVAPVIHAKWIERGSFIECSNCKCGQPYYNDTTYCPHCGAKMDKEDVE